MHCQECGQRPATVHFTKIVNGNKTETHMCEVCAKEKGEFMGQTPNGFSINSLLSGLLNFESQGMPTPTPQVLRCSSCGLTFSQFSQLGRFGCSDCYAAFEPRLEPILRRIHGGTHHSGKFPARAGVRIKQRRNIEEYRQELQLCIKQEKFEEAALLRDKIRSLEAQLGGESHVSE
jgi:protein arginine kinase activator